MKTRRTWLPLTGGLIAAAGLLFSCAGDKKSSAGDVTCEDDDDCPLELPLCIDKVCAVATEGESGADGAVEGTTDGTIEGDADGDLDGAVDGDVDGEAVPDDNAPDA